MENILREKEKTGELLCNTTWIAVNVGRFLDRLRGDMRQQRIGFTEKS